MRRRDGACRAGRGRRDGMARHRRRHRVLPADLLLFLFALPLPFCIGLPPLPGSPEPGPVPWPSARPRHHVRIAHPPALLSFLRSYIYPEASRVRTPLGFSPDDHACTLTHPRLVAGPDSGPPSRALRLRPSPLAPGRTSSLSPRLAAACSPSRSLARSLDRPRASCSQLADRPADKPSPSRPPTALPPDQQAASEQV